MAIARPVETAVRHPYSRLPNWLYPTFVVVALSLLGRVGKERVDALMHRVAEATVKELAESIAQRLESSLS